MRAYISSQEIISALVHEFLAHPETLKLPIGVILEIAAAAEARGSSTFYNLRLEAETPGHWLCVQERWRYDARARRAPAPSPEPIVTPPPAESDVDTDDAH
jgi:hypothetical protein